MAGYVPKYKVIQTSVPKAVYDALVIMATEAGRTLDELVEVLLISIVEDDAAAHKDAD